MFSRPCAGSVIRFYLLTNPDSAFITINIEHIYGSALYDSVVFENDNDILII